jgi:hypothetical protein
MPNWVDNNLTIYGDKDALDKILAILTGDSEFQQRERDYYANENRSEDTFVREFSFSNIVCPPKEIWDEYFSVHGWGENIPPIPQNNWYDWNNEHWNTKWDACEPNIERYDNSLVIHFNTAWSNISDELLDALAVILRDNGATSCGYWFEEEQGWGGERCWDSDLGTDYFRVVDDWHIPESHADYEMRGKDCICDWFDPEDWFSDCPPKEEK